MTRVLTPTSAALIDIWGRPHQLDANARIGRQVDVVPGTTEDVLDEAGVVRVVLDDEDPDRFRLAAVVGRGHEEESCVRGARARVRDGCSSVAEAGVVRRRSISPDLAGSDTRSLGRPRWDRRRSNRAAVSGGGRRT